MNFMAGILPSGQEGGKPVAVPFRENPAFRKKNRAASVVIRKTKKLIRRRPVLLP
jgi:hypothetical protein